MEEKLHSGIKAQVAGACLDTKSDMFDTQLFKSPVLTNPKAVYEAENEESRNMLRAASLQSASNCCEYGPDENRFFATKMFCRP